jgi:hypothetical protein
MSATLNKQIAATFAMEKGMKISNMGAEFICANENKSLTAAGSRSTIPRLSISAYTMGIYSGDLGSAVIKVLRYKSEGRWFDPRWCHWNFSLT